MDPRKGSMSGSRRDQYLIGVSVPLGTGVGAITAAAAGASITIGAGYGIGAGIVVSAVVILGPISVGLEEPTTWQQFALGAIAGGLLGVTLGALAAWTMDEAILDGMLVGIPGGLFLGGFLGWIYEGLPDTGDGS